MFTIHRPALALPPQVMVPVQTCLDELTCCSITLTMLRRRNRKASEVRKRMLINVLPSSILPCHLKLNFLPGTWHFQPYFVEAAMEVSSPLYYWHWAGLVMTDPFKADGPTGLAHDDGRCHLLPKEVVKPPGQAHAVAEPIPL
ncbi:hypothetical protein AAES_149893 [Amazona aestiva]|uniref:Uncharacterized protein n=1 Tax=Amazona aestiva TaxID=12930 RepID=A0A0Q3UQB2_AMAAE|nr:hypothetical protein AAES_149893 [Amazona aestiva]